MRYYSIGVQCVGTYDNIRDEETGDIVGKQLELVHWPDDDILCGLTGGRFVTRRLADQLQASNLTGFDVRSVRLVDGDQFWKYRKLYADQDLPEILLLDVNGKPGQEDFGEDIHLVVSERALELLLKNSFAHFREHSEFVSPRNQSKKGTPI